MKVKKMKVKELIKILRTLEPEAIIDMSTDEEGNSYGDIDDSLSEGELLSGKKVYTLYPWNCEQAEDRYKLDFN